MTFINYFKKHVFKTILLSTAIPFVVFFNLCCVNYAGYPSWLAGIVRFVRLYLEIPLTLIIIPLNILVFIFAPVGCIMLTAAPFFWKRKPYGLVLAGAVLLLNFIFSTAGFICARQIRYQGLKRITYNAGPIIDALERYRSVNDEYPDSLEKLKSEYLRKIPGAGISEFDGKRGEFVYIKSRIPESGKCIYPKYEHSDYNFKVIKDETNYYCTGGYELAVRVPVHPVNWDVIVFWPNKKYPKSLYHGYVKRLDDWAYVNE